MFLRKSAYRVRGTISSAAASTTAQRFSGELKQARIELITFSLVSTSQ
jgi:hypothetical protein